MYGGTVRSYRRKRFKTENFKSCEGFGAGSHYAHSGGAANWICLTKAPIYDHHHDGIQNGALVYGSEYEFTNEPHGTAFFGKDLFQQDMTCAVCASVRAMVVMIPGRNACYPGWTKEYAGYLVSGHRVNASPSEYICLDKSPEVVPGGSANQDGKSILLAEGYCGSLECPPYVHGWELTCVVCSK